MQDETISEAPILILGNKIDKDGAAGEDELRHFFGMQGQTTGKVVIIQSFPKVEQFHAVKVPVKPGVLC